MPCLMTKLMWNRIRNVLGRLSWLSISFWNKELQISSTWLVRFRLHWRCSQLVLEFVEIVQVLAVVRGLWAHEHVVVGDDFFKAERDLDFYKQFEKRNCWHCINVTLTRHRRRRRQRQRGAWPRRRRCCPGWEWATRSSPPFPAIRRRSCPIHGRNGPSPWRSSPCLDPFLGHLRTPRNKTVRHRHRIGYYCKVFFSVMTSGDDKKWRCLW